MQINNASMRLFLKYARDIDYLLLNFYRAQFSYGSSNKDLPLKLPLQKRNSFFPKLTGFVAFVWP